MADLSVQFSKMLRETLEKMQERIELQQWDNETDPHLVKKMKDLSEIYNWLNHNVQSFYECYWLRIDLTFKI